MMHLHSFLDYWARVQPDAEFAVQRDRRMTYGEALAAVNQLANALVAAGLQLGDRLAILSKNSIEYVLLYFAASKAGVVPVPLNYRLAPAEWVYILNDAGAKLLIAESGFMDTVSSIREELKTVKSFVVTDGVATVGWDDYRQWVATQPTTTPERVVSEDHDLYQMYTSGTTGHPKGAVLTHRAVIANLVQMGLIFKIQAGERLLLTMPLFHAGGANVVAFQGVYGGGSLYIQADFSPVEVIRALSEEHIRIATLAPAMLQSCLAAVPDIAQRHYRDLRLINYAASPIAEQTLRRAIEVLKCDFRQGYGMTEATVGMTSLLPSDHHRALREKPALLLSAGRPLAGTEVRIVDADDNPVPNGTIGEIVARGPQLMKGYWNRPEATAETLRGGWLHTGDAGVMDEEGYIYIQDRIKDMIVSGGENVYPRVIEEVLFQHPAIADVAVIGVPDEQWGETVKAIVVLHQGVQATAEDIMEYCRGKLGGFERPRSVDFVEALPRNSLGKVLKRTLREPYWAGQQRRVAGA
jgi:acyl-CoA synthetase (AMP-forming)/AMP-acid ligase II